MKKNAIYKIDRFQIIRLLGKGSQGTVFLAKDAYLERPVAIKVLHTRPAYEKDSQNGFLQEARAVGQLQHPNIVPIFEAGASKGIPYLVFEYVQGMSLKQLLAKHTLSIPAAMALIRQILDGVAYAHEQGVVHRDLNPSNILVSKKGVPRIMDFGISQMIGSNLGAEKKLQGTLRYMSPEHFSEKPIGPGADIFSVGLILYEMLTHTPAIHGKNDFAIIYKVIYEPTVAPSLMNPKVEKRLDSIVLKAVHKEPEARFATADSMKKEIAGYLDKKQTGAQGTGAEEGTHSTVEFLLRRMRHKTDFPAFSASVHEINKKTSSQSKASAAELANVILKDYSLTNKLLKLVNSSFYGQFKGGITSINQAVVILGFEQVRLAASSLLLFSHLQDKSTTIELRDSLIQSFMSGMMARDLALRKGIKKTEIGFLCAMFHNLGKNLTIYYFPEEYEAIKKVMNKDGLDIQGAAHHVLGISLDELGVSVARVWKFPESIIYSMRSLPEEIVQKPSSALDYLRHFAVFSNDLCELATRVARENQDEPLDVLVKRFEPSFSITKKETLSLLRSSVHQIQKYATILDIVPNQSPFIQCLLAFADTDEEEEGICAIETDLTQSHDGGKDAAVGTYDSRTKEVLPAPGKIPHGFTTPNPLALSKRLWQGATKLVNRGRHL
jgi:serine/threonine protein kinase